MGGNTNYNKITHASTIRTAIVLLCLLLFGQIKGQVIVVNESVFDTDDQRSAGIEPIKPTVLKLILLLLEICQIKRSVKDSRMIRIVVQNHTVVPVVV